LKPGVPDPVFKLAMKLHRVISGAAMSLMMAPSLLADTTVHYKYDIKFSPAAQAAGPAMTSAQARIPKSSVIQIKGKLVRTTAAQYVTVSDFEKQTVTLIDPAHHQYATVYMKDYADQVLSMMQGVPKMPADAPKVMNSMQSTFASRETGKTDTIVGIKAEETEMTLTVSMPLSTRSGNSPDAAPPAEPQVLFQLVMHVWTAIPSELQRLPALAEFDAIYGDPLASEVMNSNGTIQNIFSSMPGLGKGFAGFVDALQAKKAAVLRTEEDMYMPMVAKMLAVRAQSKAAEPGQAPDQATPAEDKTPFAEITVEVDDISSAPIDAAIFAVPRDSQLVNVPDLLRSNVPAAQANADKAPEAGAPSAAKDEVAAKD
jgi:hypothetical protein